MDAPRVPGSVVDGMLGGGAARPLGCGDLTCRLGGRDREHEDPILRGWWRRASGLGRVVSILERCRISRMGGRLVLLGAGREEVRRRRTIALRDCRRRRLEKTWCSVTERRRGLVMQKRVMYRLWVRLGCVRAATWQRTMSRSVGRSVGRIGLASIEMQSGSFAMFAVMIGG